ncbi:GNAT family N-acetyltransferase [Snodgrassella sp. CFCC 13594]|uniref:GNAT family N-acetyltransferase n=1 Tax=Snodgrassella sp. CFCC 13594 TaxID=1775559 RepID=UPI00082AA9C5|nr:GNAT family N-acetyltransferase [Snodgrassella sp. CFCC 13594]
MQITHTSQGHQGRLTASNENEVLGHLDYVMASKQIIDVHHTFVDPAARGQGVADGLLNALVAFVQENHYTIVPTCSYVAKKLPRSHPELLAQSWAP